MRSRFFTPIPVLLLLLVAVPALAEGWSPSLAPHPNLPSSFMAVDMGRQRAVLVRNQDGTLKQFREMACTTGMRNGGKLLEGDRKTPEGVYFLEARVSSGLDFDSFGNTAYPLNYPNPADRVLGKSGDGIMIHGRGRSFGPRQTLGCVVLENDDVDQLDRHVRVHATPVLIAEGIQWKSEARVGPPPDIIMATRGWAKARERRENAFFEIYDPERFEKSSGMSFAKFRQKTLREFAQYEWVDIRMQDIQVLEGPGYVVSAFAQRTMPGGEEGWRRLYWMRKVELWKIVGEEWVPQRLGGRFDYPPLVDKEIRARLDECARVWDAGDVKALLRAYDRTARRGNDEGLSAIEKTLLREMAGNGENPFRAQPAVRITKQGIEASFPARPGRRMLFLPGNFDTWVIVRESAAAES